jgi:DNA-binding response OmpR family regulator
MRILIIEDDKDIRDFLRMSLESESFAVDEASDGERGSYTARTNDYDAIILDLVLPKKDGNLVCKEIRAAGKQAPIIMLSVNSDFETKVNLLNYGADDYLTKPFSFLELRARIRALLRRPLNIEPALLEIDDLKVDTLRQRVERANRKVYLTRKEFALLEYLMKHKGTVVSRGMIMEHVWNADSDPFSNTIEAHILNVRKKVDNPSKNKLIHTIPGRGYKVDISR